jgi:hypothetical protein
MSCLACKNKESLERCPNLPLRNFIYCGRHLKARHARPWIVEHPSVLRCIVKIQAMWRGYQCRLPIQLAGKGVLRRSLCHNDEELVTLQEKHEVDPYDYFSVEEDGKVWWFDQRTMIQWSQKDLEIQNPYTRTKLTREDTRRLRRLSILRKKRNAPLYHPDQQEETTPIMRRDKRWLRIAQIVRECGFDIHHENFISLSYIQLTSLVHSLTESARWWSYEHKHHSIKYHVWFRNMRSIMHTYPSFINLSTDVAGVILTALYDVVNPDDFAFFVYGAYERANYTYAS